MPRVLDMKKWRILVVVMVLVAASLCWAAPRPASEAKVRNAKKLREEATQFAQQLYQLTDQISRIYIRPITQEELLNATITGLYRAARVEPPRDLRRDLARALEQTRAVAQHDAEPPKQVLPVAARSVERSAQSPIEALLVRLREKLGDPESLSDYHALVIACRALTPILDPHSMIVTGEEQRRMVGLDHEQFGVGLEFHDRSELGRYQIEQVTIGGPGQRAGLRPGDVLTHLEGVAIEKADPLQLVKLRSSRYEGDIAQLAVPSREDGPQDFKSGPITVEYQRPGEKSPRKTTIYRERYLPEAVLGVTRNDDQTWNYSLDPEAKIAHVRLGSLSKGSAEALREVLHTLEERKTRGLILDLRWSPGGYLNEAIEIADLFHKFTTIATVKSRSREPHKHTGNDGPKFTLPLILLVNGQTSGGAELIVGALQDAKRAVVVGQRTVGKGSVQTPIGIGVEGIGFKLTTGEFVRPSGKKLHRFADSLPSDPWGIVPDHDERVSPEFGRNLQQMWLENSLRPARSLERIALDQPKADPQQQAALKLLRKVGQ
jgi:carboxyl-terminal processing protease